jgi:DNA polymerase III delta prime subunit
MATISEINKTLDALLQGSSRPQAYLFIGPPSQTKILAEDLAVRILGQSLPHVDLVSFDATEQNSVAEVRSLLALASLKPVSSSCKVVLMSGLEQANTAMQNALLKTLEEPPSQTVFVLASQIALLPTVMSRCQVFNVSAVGSLVEDETTQELTELLILLKQTQGKGIAERLALVNTLAGLDDQVLPKLLEAWLAQQVSTLKTEPKRFTVVRTILNTKQALQGSFNKKLVLQQFVTNGL